MKFHEYYTLVPISMKEDIPKNINESMDVLLEKLSNLGPNPDATINTLVTACDLARGYIENINDRLNKKFSKEENLYTYAEVVAMINIIDEDHATKLMQLRHSLQPLLDKYRS